eukprot:Hpha_TRINITY_DN30265_c0_g1::TRINITY_DN30265_c0_g1_i1::g.27038::m.27038
MSLDGSTREKDKDELSSSSRQSTSRGLREQGVELAQAIATFSRQVGHNACGTEEASWGATHPSPVDEAWQDPFELWTQEGREAEKVLPEITEEALESGPIEFAVTAPPEKTPPPSDGEDSPERRARVTATQVVIAHGLSGYRRPSVVHVYRGGPAPVCWGQRGEALCHAKMLYYRPWTLAAPALIEIPLPAEAEGAEMVSCTATTTYVVLRLKPGAEAPAPAVRGGGGDGSGRESGGASAIVREEMLAEALSLMTDKWNKEWAQQYASVRFSEDWEPPPPPSWEDARGAAEHYKKARTKEAWVNEARMLASDLEPGATAAAAEMEELSEKTKKKLYKMTDERDLRRRALMKDEIRRMHDHMSALQNLMDIHQNAADEVKRREQQMTSVVDAAAKKAIENIIEVTSGPRRASCFSRWIGFLCMKQKGRRIHHEAALLTNDLLPAPTGTRPPPAVGVRRRAGVSPMQLGRQRLYTLDTHTLEVTVVPGLETTPVSSVVTGRGHALVLGPHGVFEIGRRKNLPPDAVLPLPLGMEGVVLLDGACGSEHSVVLVQVQGTTRLFGVGRGGEGQLGVGVHSEAKEAVIMEGISEPILGVSAGGTCTLVRTRRGVTLLGGNQPPRRLAGMEGKLVMDATMTKQCVAVAARELRDARDSHSGSRLRVWTWSWEEVNGTVTDLKGPQLLDLSLAEAAVEEDQRIQRERELERQERERTREERERERERLRREEEREKMRREEERELSMNLMQEEAAKNAEEQPAEEQSAKNGEAGKSGDSPSETPKTSTPPTIQGVVSAIGSKLKSTVELLMGRRKKRKRKTASQCTTPTPRPDTTTEEMSMSTISTGFLGTSRLSAEHVVGLPGLPKSVRNIKILPDSDFWSGFDPEGHPTEVVWRGARLMFRSAVGTPGLVVTLEKVSREEALTSPKKPKPVYTGMPAVERARSVNAALFFGPKPPPP